MASKWMFLFMVDKCKIILTQHNKFIPNNLIPALMSRSIASYIYWSLPVMLRLRVSAKSGKIMGLHLHEKSGGKDACRCECVM